MSVPTVVGHDVTRHDILMRLRRAEGQVRGLERQIENDAACIDVLTQLHATTRALEGVALLLMTEHLHSCVTASASPAALEVRSREISGAVAGLIGA